MKRTDNRGISMVELLVAVCIMAVIAIPLLHSFVSSHRVNARSRQTLRATTLAQNEMEIFEKEKIADLSDPDKFAYDAVSRKDGYHVDAPDDPSDNGCYVFSRKGIINDKSGREEFDVYVTLDPLRGDPSERYYNVNDVSLLSMNTISVMDTGTYVQRVRTENNAVDQDTLAYSYFNVNKIGSATLEDIKKNIKRTITIDISKETKEIGTFTTAKVTYLYECSTSIVPEEKKFYREEQLIYNNAQNLDDAGKPIELKGIYLFYAPRYGIPDVNKADTIVVNNPEGVAADIYIIRQDLLVEGGSDVQTVPMDYLANLVIYEKVDGEGNCGGSYHTNLNIDEPPADGLGQMIGIRLQDLSGSIYSRDQAIAATGMKLLGVSEKKDRIYEMTVKVFKAGDDFTTASPLVTLTGTKLE